MAKVEDRMTQNAHARFVFTCEANKSLDEQFQIHDVRSPWIGVDLDGTLAFDSGRELWDENGNPKIGRPINEMVHRIKKWVNSGCTVKIFTARASSSVQVAAIRTWLGWCDLPDLEITNVKDLNMVELWDDRCVQVIPNSGRPLNPEPKLRQRRPSRRVPDLSLDLPKSGFRWLSSLKQTFLT